MSATVGILFLLLALTSSNDDVKTELGFKIDSEGNAKSFFQVVFSRNIISEDEKQTISKYIFPVILHGDKLLLNKKWDELTVNQRKELKEKHNLDSKLWDVILEIGSKFNTRSTTITISQEDMLYFLRLERNLPWEEVNEKRKKILNDLGIKNEEQWDDFEKSTKFSKIFNTSWEDLGKKKDTKILENLKKLGFNEYIWQIFSQ